MRLPSIRRRKKKKEEFSPLDFAQRGDNQEGLVSSQQARGYFWLRGGFRDPILLVMQNFGRWVTV